MINCLPTGTSILVAVPSEVINASPPSPSSYAPFLTFVRSHGSSNVVATRRSLSFSLLQKMQSLLVDLSQTVILKYLFVVRDSSLFEPFSPPAYPRLHQRPYFSRSLCSTATLSRNA